MALTVWLVLAAVWLLFLVPVLVLRRRVDRYAWPAWNVTLSGEVAAHYAYLHEWIGGNVELVRDTLAAARAHQQRGATATARARLAQVFGTIDDLVGRGQARLDEWRVICRAALTLYPVPPLPRGVFQLRALRGLAAVHHLAHAVAVTSGERFRLRLGMLACGFWLLARAARHAARRLGRAASGPVVPEPHWQRARVIAHDFDAVSHEMLASSRALLSAVETAGEPSE